MDLCRPSDFLAFSALAPTKTKPTVTKDEATLQKAKLPTRASGQAGKPDSSLASSTATAQKSQPDVPTSSPTLASDSTLEASSAIETAQESTVHLSAKNFQQADVSRVTATPPADRLPAAVENPSEPDLERSFTREGLLRFLPRLREQLPKDLYAQVEAFVNTEEEEHQPSGDGDLASHEDSVSLAQDSLPCTTPPQVGTFADKTPRELSPARKIITKKEPLSSKSADALPGPSAPLSIVEDSASIEHPSLQSTKAAAAPLRPERPALSAEDEAKLSKGVIVDRPSMAAQSNETNATSVLQESQQAAAAMRSGRQSLAKSLMRQRDALIGEHVHKSRFSHTTTSLEKRFANLRISDTDDSQGTAPNTVEVPASTSNVASHRKGPTLPAFLQAIQRESDSGTAARDQYSGNIESRTSTDPTGSNLGTLGRERPRSTSSSTADPLSFPPSRITPRPGEGPKLPAFLLPRGLHSGSEAATHAAPSVPGRATLKENQNPFARRPNNPNVNTGSQPLASVTNTNTSVSSTPPHLKSRRSKPSGPAVPSFLQEAMAAQKKYGTK